MRRGLRTEVGRRWLCAWVREALGRAGSWVIAAAAEAHGCFVSFLDHLLHPGQGHLHSGLQCLPGLPYNGKRNSLRLQVSVRNE